MSLITQEHINEYGRKPRKFDIAGLQAKLARGEMLTRAETVDLCDEFESLMNFVEEIKAGLYSGCDKIADRLKEYEVEF